MARPSEGRIELIHQGTNEIKYGAAKDAIFKPGQTMSFPKEVGEKLVRLYPQALANTKTINVETAVV